MDHFDTNQFVEEPTMRSLSKISVVTAAAGLALAPVAAQAGTRAASSPVTVDVQRGASGTTDSGAIAGFNWAWILLLLAAIAALIALIDDGRTRGG